MQIERPGQLGKLDKQAFGRGKNAFSSGNSQRSPKICRCVRAIFEELVVLAVRPQKAGERCLRGT